MVQLDLMPPALAALHVLQSAQTLRFELFHRAGEFVRPNGGAVLRRFESIAARLPRAA